MERRQLEEYKMWLESLSEIEKKERDLYLRDLSLGNLFGPLTGYASIDKPWFKYFEASHMNLPVEAMCNYDYFLKATERFPKKTVLLDYYGRKYTRDDIKHEVDNNIKRFISMGIKRGDSVSFVMLDTPEILFMWYALTKLGASANMIKFDESGERIKYMTELTKSKYLFVTAVPFIVEHVNEALKTGMSINKIIVAELTEALPLPLQARMLFDQIKMGREIKQKLLNGQKISIQKNLNEIRELMDELKESKQCVADIMNSNSIYESYKKWVRQTPKAKMSKNLDNFAAEVSATVYTGGTTGAPKGVKLTNNNLNAMAHAIHHGDETYSLGKTALNILPPAIAYYFNSLHGNLCAGVKVHLISHFTVEEYPYLIRNYEPNIFMSGPILLESIRKADIIENSSFMDAPVSGGDKLYEDEEEAWNEKYPLVHQGWGMSEASAGTTYAKTNCYKLGSVGIPLINVTVGVFEYKTEEEIARGEEGQELTYGEIGELCITGPTLMQGYFDNDEATKKVLRRHSDGTVWLHTDDLGFIDKDGCVFHRGRAKRMITRKGEKLWLTNIEDLVSSHPLVEKCSCVRKADDKEREVPVLHLVLVDNNVDVVALKEELTSLIVTKLNELYVPKYYVIRDDLVYSEVNKKCDTKALESEDIYPSSDELTENIIYLNKDHLLKRHR